LPRFSWSRKTGLKQFRVARAPLRHRRTLHENIPVLPAISRAASAITRHANPDEIPPADGRSDAPPVAVRSDFAEETPAFLEQQVDLAPAAAPDRKSTRLNSSHVKISYAVFCLK